MEAVKMVMESVERCKVKRLTLTPHYDPRVEEWEKFYLCSSKQKKKKKKLRQKKRKREDKKNKRKGNKKKSKRC
ncbi:hypothetical protein A2U01_0058661 [Trifolium medium]|uniref:Uncharacterized protein n=1 Tax=Trifolium medium TaxID=97028 RepID=A0A392RMD0_9FABA|nr:hypothetical protein [Trifolium medium]